MVSAIFGALVIITIWCFALGWGVTVVVGWFGHDLTVTQGALIVLLLAAIARMQVNK